MTLVESIFETGLDQTAVAEYTEKDWDQLIIDFLMYFVKGEPEPIHKKYKTVGEWLTKLPGEIGYTDRVKHFGDFLIVLPQRQREIFVTIVDSWKRNLPCFALVTIYHVECLHQHPNYKQAFYEEVLKYPIFTGKLKDARETYCRFICMFPKEILWDHLEKQYQDVQNK